jgi:hypothetical protein
MFPLTADTDPEITSCLILEHLSVLEDKLQQYCDVHAVGNVACVDNRC